MLTPFDVSNLNNSIESVGRSLAGRRIEQANRAHQAALENLQESRIGAQQQHYNAMEQHYAQMEQGQSEHYKTMEDKIGLQDSLKQMEDTGKRLATSMSNIGAQVRSGAMSQDDATSYFKQSLDGMDSTLKQHLLSNPDMAAAYDGNFDWEIAGATPDNMERVEWTAPDGTPMGAWKNKKNGSLHVDPNNKPVQIGETTTPGQGGGTVKQKQYGTLGPNGITPVGQSGGAAPGGIPTWTRGPGGGFVPAANPGAPPPSGAGAGSYTPPPVPGPGQPGWQPVPGLDQNQ